jgi:arylsulfatase A-like enzyme
VIIVSMNADRLLANIKRFVGNQLFNPLQYRKEPNMRPLTKYAIIVVTAWLAGFAMRTEGSERPNMIFIMADDLGYADLGCYGQNEIQTPCIDRLAAEGVRFTQCYAGSTVCAPSRSVLMTGRHTGHTTVRGNFGKGGVQGLGGGQGRVPLRAEDVTVAEIFKQAGYATGMTGKWGLGEPNTTGLPNDQGFDEWFGYLNQRRAHTYYPDYLWLNRERFPLPGNTNGSREQYTHDLMTDFALDFIKTNAEAPFFLYVPYTIPHSALEVPELGIYAGNDEWSDKEQAFAAMVTRMDTDIGRMTTLLDELEISDNTLIFFCSDNGAALRFDGRFDSSGPLRGRKRDMYEGGIRVPMIVSWPAQIEAGRTSDAVWWFADLLPTACDLTGVPLPSEDEIDGVSILPLLLDETDDVERPAPLYWEFYESGFSQAIRLGQWKAVRKKPGQPLELYDLASDSGEANDIAKQHPDVVAEMETLLLESRIPSKEWPSPIDVESGI